VGTATDAVRRVAVVGSGALSGMRHGVDTGFVVFSAAAQSDAPALAGHAG
jgi:hypothetical protein